MFIGWVQDTILVEYAAYNLLKPKFLLVHMIDSVPVKIGVKISST